MDPLFKNSYVRDRQMAKELYRFFYFKRKILVFYNILFAFGLIMGLIIEKHELLALQIIIATIFYTVQTLLYRQNINVALKRDLEIFKKEPTIIITVTNDNITHCIKDDNENTLEFSSIKNAIQTKNYIFLRTKANLVYALKKDGFTLGTKENFIPFLKSKNIKVKGK